MPTYTVIGLFDCHERFTVAAVLAGDAPVADTEPGDAESGTQRIATVVEATDRDHAEQLAHAELDDDV